MINNLQIPPPMSSEEWNAFHRAIHRKDVQREWSGASNLPSPVYDPREGWKLDEFAMYYDPDGLRSYKEFRHQVSQSKRLRPLRSWPPFLEEFPKTIQRQLLEARYEVKGIRPDCYDLELIPIVLLQHMLPILETSEQIDPTPGADRQRRYDHVRVFRLKGSPGGTPIFNWRAMAERLKQDGITYATDAKLVAFCIKTVPLLSPEMPDRRPDDKTAREAIAKRGLWKFSQEKGNGSPGK